SLGLHRLGIKAWPLAVLVPLAVIGIAYGVVWSIGVAGFSPPAGLDAADWATGLTIGLFQNLVIIGVTVSLGEELGWRGYLQPRRRPPSPHHPPRHSATSALPRL